MIERYNHVERAMLDLEALSGLMVSRSASRLLDS